jgi:hypothetical protein
LENTDLLSWRSIAFFSAVATEYGAFVFAVLIDSHQIELLRAREITAALHLLLLINLFILSLKLYNNSIRAISTGDPPQLPCGRVREPIIRDVKAR